MDAAVPQEADRGSSDYRISLLPPSLRSQTFLQSNATNMLEAIAGLSQLQQRRALFGSDNSALMAASGGSRIAKQLHLASEATLGGWRAGLYAPRIRAEATARVVAAGCGGSPDGPGTALANRKPNPCTGNSTATDLQSIHTPWRPPADQALAWQQLFQGLKVEGICASASTQLPPAQEHRLSRLMQRGALALPVDSIVEELRARAPAAPTGVAAARGAPCPYRPKVSRCPAHATIRTLLPPSTCTHAR